MTQVDDTLLGGAWRSSVQLELSPILLAALDAFNEHGYHGTTVRDIARRVGVTVPALYYHHANKEDILHTLQMLSIDRLAGLCRAAVVDAGDDTEQRLLNLIEALVRYMAHSTKLAALDSEIRSLSAERRAAYVERRREVEQLLVEAVQAGMDAGHFDVRSARDTARALIGMVQAIAVWYHPEGEVSPAALARKYAEIAAHTVGASPDLVRRLRDDNKGAGHDE
ncbi:TetR/AcrR family transcriptional regulator [Nocardioides pacificus]